jgi:hypothetical protein
MDDLVFLFETSNSIFKKGILKKVELGTINFKDSLNIELLKIYNGNDFNERATNAYQAINSIKDFLKNRNLMSEDTYNNNIENQMKVLLKNLYV